MLMPDEVPDDAEPWENRPDAAADLHEDVVVWLFRRFGDDGAVTVANQVLAEYQARRAR